LSESALNQLNDTFSNDQIESDIYPQSLSDIFDALLTGRGNFELTLEQLANKTTPALIE
jgi:hypothetical protein